MAAVGTSAWSVRWWRSSPDPVVHVLRGLVLVLWPTTLVWLLPGQHGPGYGLALAGGLAVTYSVGAVLLLRTPADRLDGVLPTVLALFTAAAVLGTMAGPEPRMALLVPLFLGVLSAIAALRLDVRPTLVQVGLAGVAAVVCVAYAADNPLQVAMTSVAVVAGVAAPSLAILRLREQLDAARAREHHLARTDSLTGTLNRRGLDEEVSRLLERAAEVDVVTLDLDRFKLLNDTSGHAAGDEALRRVALALTTACAEVCDAPVLVARLGGEEFLVVAAAGACPLRDLAEVVRAAATVRSEDGWATSASVGAVRRPGPGGATSPADWLRRQIDAADLLMYRAKRSGGDRVLAEVA